VKVLAVSGQKGGIAKTTSALYLATRFAETLAGTGERPVIALIDRDNSRNLTRLIETMPDLLRPGVDLLPSEFVPPAGTSYQIAIIDTPPGLDAINSLKEANLIVVPVTPETQGILNLVDHLENIRIQQIIVNPAMRLLALLPTRVMAHVKAHQQRLEDIRAIAAARRPPLLVLPPIPERMRIQRYELDAPDYDRPAKELLTHAQILDSTSARA
jgi:cellulose biosynthesis protein BcsQ